MNARLEEVMSEEMERPLTEEERAAQEEWEKQRQEIMSSITQDMNTKLSKAIQYKAPVEARMLIDEAQYWGRSYVASSKDDPTNGKSGNQQIPVDNKTRSKTRIASSRIGDMLFPTNAPNWDLRPSPYPEVPDDALRAQWEEDLALWQQSAQEGEQPPKPDLLLLADKVAAKACRRMVRRIRDALSACSYAKHGRAAIEESCRLGTGVIKGPYKLGVLRRHYTPVLAADGSRVDVSEKSVVPTPAVSRVSVWNFFPLPARNIEECEGAFELHLPTATTLRQMVTTYGFDREATRDVLRAGPHRGEVDSLLSQRSAVTGENNINYESNFALWEYHGPIPREVFDAWGVDTSNEEDELDSLYGEVWFCHGTILKVSLSMLEADSTLPYHVFNYEKDETSIFGFGIPFIMRDDQRVIDTMWDAMLFNAAVSAGPQILITKGLITPADNSYNVRGPKLWYKNDEDISAKDAMESWVIPSTINNNMPLYERAKQNADENTNLPLLMGDAMAQASNIPASGLAMMLNQQNIVQRQSAHGWDDDVTGRMIPMFYDWFMQHDPDPSIKGDFEVEVRGASHLLIKDAQAQHAQLLIQMAAQDPQMASMLNLDMLYRVYLGFLDVPVDQLLKTPDQIAREQAQAQPSPMQQLEMEEKQASIAKLQAEAQKAQQPQGAQLTEKDLMEMELEYAKIGAAQQAQDAQLQIEQMRQQTQLLRVAADENIAYEKIAADMEKFFGKLNAEGARAERKQASDDYFNAARLRIEEYRDRLKAVNLGRGFDTFG